MSLNKRWIVKDVRTSHAAEISEISKSLGISSLTAALLYGRGFDTPEKARSFLQRDEECFPDPFLLTDMDMAVSRIMSALERHEKITVYGDYDVDGVTATSMLFLYLKSKGADVNYYIPDRLTEGYGVNIEAIDEISKSGSSLIITVDTGITAVAETDYASALGIDVVVTDHHCCGADLPKACAVVNPHRPDSRYPFKELAGVGVAFKLVCALEKTFFPDEKYIHRVCADYGDLAAVGTIADVMPLFGENRLIVSIGLKLIEEERNAGFAALCAASCNNGKTSEQNQEQKKRKVNSTYIGYTIAPRINASGRIRNASVAVELLTTRDKCRAKEIAGILCEINRDRQEYENTIIEEACEIIERTHDFSHDRVIVISAENWHHGVIGIAASRITERYGLPSILISFDGGHTESEVSDDDIGRGSCRSVKELNLADALSSCGQYLIKYGGHEMAAGLSLKRSELESFRRAVNEYAFKNLTAESMTPTIEADAEVMLSELSMNAVSELSMLEPYGTSNPVPVFVLRGAKITGLSEMGGGKHTRLQIVCDGINASAVMFGMAPSELSVFRDDMADMMFTPDINEFRGIRSVQLIVRDIRVCRRTVMERKVMIEEYSKFAENPGISISEDLLPVRSDFKNVYLYIRRELDFTNGKPINLYKMMKHTTGESVTAYIKLRFILAIFLQTGIVSYSDIPDYTAAGGSLPIVLNDMNSKVDLKTSEIYQALLSRISSAGSEVR